MNMTTKELLKAYEEELDLDEKLKYNDYESIGELFIFRGILLRSIVDLTQEEYDRMIKYEKVIEKYKESWYPLKKTRLFTIISQECNY